MTPDYIERITPAVVRRIIEDTSVPKTFRKTFENYLKWRKKQ